MKPLIYTILISSLITAVIGFWLFEFGWSFLAVPFLSGVAIAIMIKQNRVVKFLDKIFVGSLAYGFLSLLLTYSRYYLLSKFIYHSGFPFWPVYNPREYFYGSLVFAFICFMGGLVGILVKGFYSIYYKKYGQSKH